MTNTEKTKLLKAINNQAIAMNKTIEELLLNGEDGKALEMANQVSGLLLAFDIINAMGK